MISYIKGTVLAVEDSYIIVKAGDVGYKIYQAPGFFSGRLFPGTPIELYTFFYFREAIFRLYGFETFDQLKLFELLLEVSGIGPRLALNLIASVNDKDLKEAIALEKVDYLHKLPGIGKKTAQKIIFDLKDKISFDNRSQGSPASFVSIQEAEEALLSLGYSRHEFKSYLEKDKDNFAPLNAKDIVFYVLKEMGKR